MKNVMIILAFLFAAIFFASSVFAEPQLQASSSVSPSPVSPGSDGYVQLTLTNTGTSSASSIQIIGIIPESGIQVTSSGTINLGALGNGQSTTALVKFSVSSSASSGLYTIRFAIDICSSTCTEVDPTAVVTVQSPSSLQVASIQPDTLAAGQSATLNFNLVNEGTDAVNNIVLTWQTPNNEILPLGLSNRQFISSIEGAASLDIPINVSVGSSVSPGVYPLTITLSYHDKSGTLQSVNSSIGILVGGTTDFDVAVQQYSAGTLSLSVANVGVNPATSVSVDFIQDNNTNYAVSGATSSFIGTLNPGDFSVANFVITQRFTRNQTSGTQTPTFSSAPLNLQISYTDTNGARQSVQKEVALSLSSTLTATNSTRSRGLGMITILIIIVVVVVIAVVLLWLFKFRKKKVSLNFLRRIVGKPSK